MGRRLRPLILALALGADGPWAATVARAEWLADADGALVYEDNLSRAATARDEKSDLALVGTLSAGPSFQVTNSTSLRLTGDLKGRVYTEFEGLTSLSTGLTVAARRKFGLGPFAPWVRAFGSAAYLNYRDDVLDSLVLDAGAEVGKRVHERVDLQAGYLYEVREAGTAVFDQAAHILSVRGILSLTDAVDLVVGGMARWGDFTVHRAVTTPRPPRPARVVETFDVPLYAFRIDAATYTASLSLSYALSRHAAVSLGYEYQFTQGPRVTYTNNVCRASLSYRY